ncbi:MAG: RNA pseudouridine synthase [Myxococcota bacterium]
MSEVGVIHRSAHLLVLAKPAGLPTTARPGRDSLARRAAELDPDAPRLHATSRLDADVTGLVTFARTRRGNDALLAARDAGVYERRYLALASGAPTPPEGAWTTPIGSHAKERRLRAAGGADARAAHTEYRTRARTAEAALLLLAPRSGRTHQLRVHAAHAGVALLGDVAYGGARRVVRATGEVLTARRVMLHCAALTLTEPSTGTIVHLSAAVPADLRALYLAAGGAEALLDLNAPVAVGR